MGQYEPGQPPVPQMVVYEISSRTGLGRIAAIPGYPDDTKTITRELNQQRETKIQNRSEPAWRGLEAGPSLREFADFERRGEKPGKPENKVPVDSPSMSVRPIVRGNFTADVIQRVGEDGTLERTVLISHRSRDEDGVERIDGASFSLDELMPHGLEVSAIRSRINGQVQVAPNEAKEQGRPSPDQGHQTPNQEDRLQDRVPPDQGQAPPNSEQVRREPVQERNEREQSHPDRDQVSRDREAGEPQQRRFKLDFPTLNPDPPANGVQGNRFIIAGVWHGVEPPKDGQFAFFTQGKSHLSERMVIPAGYNTEIAEPGDRPQYVIGEVIAKNVIQLFGSNRDMNFIAEQEALMEQKGVKLEQDKQPKQSKILPRTSPGITFADLNEILAMPQDLVEPVPSNAPSSQNEHSQQNGHSHQNGIAR